MSKPVKFLTPLFLGVSLFLADPSFAEETRTFTKAEARDYLSLERRADCIVGAVTPSAWLRKFKVLSEEGYSDVYADAEKECGSIYGITKEQAQEFSNSLHKKYGTENLEAVVQNSGQILRDLRYRR